MGDSGKAQLNVSVLTCLLEGCRQTSPPKAVTVSFNDHTQAACL